MKYLHYALLFIATSFIGCSPSQSSGKLEGVWRYEAPVVAEKLLGGDTVVTERFDLKLTTDGKVDLQCRRGDNVYDSIEGEWKRNGDLLVMTRPDSSFGVFKIIAVESSELRILTRAGKLYRLSRMP